MIFEPFENYAKLDGAWLQLCNDANVAAIKTARIGLGQVELTALTERFLTQRIRAYAEYGWHVEGLVRRLDDLTKQYGEDYSRQLREIYSSWSDLLRHHYRSISSTPTQMHDEQRRSEPRNVAGDAQRGDGADEPRPETPPPH